MEEATAVVKRLGIFRTAEFVEKGFPREYLRRLLENGTVEQLGRGRFVSSSFDGDQNQSLVEVAKYFPRGVICLNSALRFHEIGTQAPFQVWLAIPRGTNLPQGSKLPIRFCKYAPDAHAFGIETHKVAGGSIRVYSPAKTVADCFKFRNRYGLDVAVEALREGWRDRKFTTTQLGEAANVCRVGRVMAPYLEMLT